MKRMATLEASSPPDGLNISRDLLSALSTAAQSDGYRPSTCDRCQKINFRRSVPHPGHQREKIPGIGRSSTTCPISPNADCVVCGILFDMQAEEVKYEKTKLSTITFGDWRLVAHPAASLFWNPVAEDITTILSVSRSENHSMNRTDCFLVPTGPSNTISERPLTSTIDWNHIKGWLDFAGPIISRAAEATQRPIRRSVE
jgi:hypothetical protein